MSCTNIDKIINFLKNKNHQLYDINKFIDKNLQFNHTFEYYEKISNDIYIIFNYLIHCLQNNTDELSVNFNINFNHISLIDEIKFEQKISIIEQNSNSIHVSLPLNLIYPYFINFLKETSSITNIYFNYPSQDRNQIKYVTDNISLKNEPRRILYGWNEQTGNQLHKYLPPDFDEYTRDINNFIKEKQKEYYVAIIDDGLITNKADYNLIANNRTTFCPDIGTEPNKFFEDFKNCNSNPSYQGDDSRDIIIYDNMLDHPITSNNWWTSYTQKTLEPRGICNLGSEQNIGRIKDKYNDLRETYGRHGTPVTSCCAGYDVGIAPNVNIISYRERSSLMRILDVISSKNKNIYEDGKYNKYKNKIIGINLSAGPRANTISSDGSTPLFETIDPIKKNTNHPVTSMGFNANDFVWTIACGNDNDDIYSRDHFRDNQLYRDMVGAMYLQSENNLNKDKTVRGSEFGTTHDNNYKLTGHNSRWYSKDSGDKGYYGAMEKTDRQLEHNVLSVGSFTYYDKEITPYSQSGHPYYYYTKPDVVAPGDVYCTYRNGNQGIELGTSYSAPMICGLSVLVRCLVDYLVEREGAPPYLQTPEMIRNLLRESSIQFSNGVNNLFYTKTDQGFGVPTLFNVYKYLRTQNYQVLSSPFYNNSLIKTRHSYTENDSECTGDTIIDKNECREFAYKFSLNKELIILNEDYNNIHNQDEFCEVGLGDNSKCSKRSYEYQEEFEDNSNEGGYCILNKNTNIVKFIQRGVLESGDKMICKKQIVNNNNNKFPLCYKRKEEQDQNRNIILKDFLTDENGNFIKQENYDNQYANNCYKADSTINTNYTENVSNFFNKNINCNGESNNNYRINKYGMCVLNNSRANEKGMEIVFRNQQGFEIVIIGIIVLVICLFFSIKLILKD